MELVHEGEVSGVRVRAVQGDLTAMDVDAIVNAANRELRHGGGVAGAIARAGGAAIQRESDAWVDRHGPLAEGQVAVTTAGELPARRVIHTAGPVYDEGSDRNEPLLRAAVRGALEAAAEAGLGTVAFPAISAGIYGYPPDDATRIIADEVAGFLGDRHGAGLREVRLVGYDRPMADRFAAAVRAVLG